MTTRRREFLTTLGTLGALGAAAALRPAALHAAAPNGRTPDDAAPSTWDTSWLDQLAAARYRAVFNGTDVADGIALDLAEAFLDGNREVHGARDGESRAVIVYRRTGSPVAMGDATWARYDLGVRARVTDRETRAPARRNVFLSTRIEPLQKRGLILLVCSVSLRSFSHGFAESSGKPLDEVLAEVKANLVPGAIPVPNGVWALGRAQNAGCAYMTGS